MKKILLSLIVVFGLAASLANAQVVSVKGSGTIGYSSSLSSSDKEKAYQKAQLSAVETYFAERGQADYEAFESNRDRIVENLDDFITNTSILNEQDKPGINKYTVVVKVSLNETKLNVLMRKSSAVSKAPPGSKSKIVFIFIGREAASVRSFDERVVKRAEVSSTSNKSYTENKSGTEGENITETNGQISRISTDSSKTKTSFGSGKDSVKVETGGSVTRKADDTKYRAFPLADQRSAITSVFSQAGYKVADYETVMGDKEIKAIIRDYSSGNDLQPSTIRSIYQSLRTNGVPIFVIATLNLDAPVTDPSSGLQREAVRISARALDVNDGTEIASVPPVSQFGLGVTNRDAIDVALKNGSLAAAKEVVSRLNAVGSK